MTEFTDTRLIPTPGHVGFLYSQMERIEYDGKICCVRYVPNADRPHKREEFRFALADTDLLEIISITNNHDIAFINKGVPHNSRFHDLQDASDKLDEFYRGAKYTLDNSHDIKYIKDVVRMWEEELQPAFMACNMSKPDSEKFVDCILICCNLKRKLSERHV